MKITEGMLVKIRPCCGPGGVHEGHEDRCRVLPPGQMMCVDDYPHEHDHKRTRPFLTFGVWEVREENLGAGVFVRRPNNKETALVDEEALVVLSPLEAVAEARRHALREASDRCTRGAAEEEKWIPLCSDDEVPVADIHAHAATTLEEVASDILDLEKRLSDQKETVGPPTVVTLRALVNALDRAQEAPQFFTADRNEYEAALNTAREVLAREVLAREERS